MKGKEVVSGTFYKIIKAFTAILFTINTTLATIMFVHKKLMLR
jgi:hypothetical protein